MCTASLTAPLARVYRLTISTGEWYLHWGMFRAVLAASRALRVFSAILAIAAMLCVLAASVSAAHTHVKEPVGRCDVCSAAHQTAQRIAVIQVVHAPALHSRMAQPVAAPRVESHSVLTLHTRGPPYSLPNAA